MEIPFTTEQFYEVFREYNMAVWPVQVILVGLAVAAIVLMVFPRRWSGAGISAILAFLWAWLGIVYHYTFFASINPAAYAFAVISLLGSLVFLWQGVVRKQLDFQMTPTGRTIFGSLLIFLALLVFPVWSILAGHSYPDLPTFGLPCPTTLFTIGLLAFLVRPYARSPFVIPVVWSFTGGLAAILLDVPQDYGLFVAGVIGLVLMTQNKAASA